MGIITVVLPVFCVVLLGWLLRFGGIIKADSAKHFHYFTRVIAAPALILLTLASTNFDSIWNWEFVGTFGITMVAVFIVAFYFLRMMVKKQLNVGGVRSFALISGNVTSVGLPLLFGIFGRRAIVPAILALIMLFIIAGICTFILEFPKHKTGAFGKSLKRAVTLIIVNPYVIAAIIGGLYSLTTLPIPSGIAKFLHVLEIALVAIGLITWGITIHIARFAKIIKTRFLYWAIGLIILPALMLWVVWAFAISPIWAIVAIIVAGLPQAGMAHGLATTYCKDKGTKTIAEVEEATEINVLLSVFSLFIWFIILYQIYPAEFRSTLSFY